MCDGIPAKQKAQAFDLGYNAFGVKDLGAGLDGNIVHLSVGRAGGVRATGTEHDTRNDHSRQDEKYLFHRSFVYFPVEDAFNGIHRMPKLPFVTDGP